MKKYKLKLLFLLVCVSLLFCKCMQIYAVATQPPLVPVQAPESGSSTTTPATAVPMENKPTASLTYSNTKYGKNDETRKAVAKGAYKKKQTPPPGQDAEDKPNGGKFTSYEQALDFVIKNKEKSLSKSDIENIKNYIK